MGLMNACSTVICQGQNLKVCFIIIAFAFLYFLLQWNRIGRRVKLEPLPLPRPVAPKQKSHEKGSSSTLQTPSPAPVSTVRFHSDEWAKILQALRWDGPVKNITKLDLSTSPNHTTFHIQGLRPHYHVGDEVFVTVTARDFHNNKKQYGGDFFQARLFSSKLKASVFGEVTDHWNGTYSVRFLLPWVGNAQVFVRLIHSSEAVQVIKRHRDSDLDRINFFGIYQAHMANGETKNETVKCHLKFPGKDILGGKNCCCEYPDSRTGEIWQCKRPKSLPCNTLLEHCQGALLNHLTKFEESLTSKTLTDQHIRGDQSVLNILPSNKSLGVTEKCKPGLQTPIPAGFYLQDVWISFVCAAHRFTISEAVQCLKDKHIHMFGDSTMRQWFEQLSQNIPSLKEMKMHAMHKRGPRLAVDVDNNIVLQWRPHGLPLIGWTAPISFIHYISNELDDLPGVPNTVVVFNIAHHLAIYPLDVYARRVARIRESVVALLRRAPMTTIIIKTANTGPKNVHLSDWLVLQLDRIMREAFKDIGVFILDVWQMTACHDNENIHPWGGIVNNELQILYSVICPK